jgi:hypothetical protein
MGVIYIILLAILVIITSCSIYYGLVFSIEDDRFYLGGIIIGIIVIAVFSSYYYFIN